jgi:hypothetical protein
LSLAIRMRDEEDGKIPLSDIFQINELVYVIDINKIYCNLHIYVYQRYEQDIMQLLGIFKRYKLNIYIKL